jgi:hypothetical protein
MNDRLTDLMAELPHATVAPDRARRTQERCHRVLDRRAAMMPGRPEGLPYDSTQHGRRSGLQAWRIWQT